jgi:hypothetical protein
MFYNFIILQHYYLTAYSNLETGLNRLVHFDSKVKNPRNKYGVTNRLPVFKNPLTYLINHFTNLKKLSFDLQLHERTSC